MPSRAAARPPPGCRTIGSGDQLATVRTLRTTPDASSASGPRRGRSPPATRRGPRADDLLRPRRARSARRSRRCSRRWRDRVRRCRRSTKPRRPGQGCRGRVERRGGGRTAPRSTCPRCAAHPVPGPDHDRRIRRRRPRSRHRQGLAGAGLTAGRAESVDASAGDVRPGPSRGRLLVAENMGRRGREGHHGQDRVGVLDAAKPDMAHRLPNGNTVIST